MGIMTNTTDHPFTRAGLGVAPFHVVTMFEAVWRACVGAPLIASGSCDACGTSIRWVYVVVDARGRRSHVGSDCALKADRELGAGCKAALRAHRAELRDRATRAERQEAQERVAAAAAAWRQAHPDLAAALTLDAPGVNGLAQALDRNGYLSEGETAWLTKIAATAARRAREVHIAAPLGKRRAFTGEVVGCKRVDGVYGASWKLTIRVAPDAARPDDVWFAWVTMPKALDDKITAEEYAIRTARGPYEYRTAVRQALVGRTVSLVADLVAGREPHFAIGKRPRLA